MEWIDVKEKLPPHGLRVLAFCTNKKFTEGNWKGIVDVVFDSNLGWIRAENEGEKVFVTHWFDYPIEPPALEEEIE